MWDLTHFVNNDMKTFTARVGLEAKQTNNNKK